MNKDLDLIGIIKELWAGKRTIIVATIVMMVFGLIVALKTPKYYTVTTTMVSQSSAPLKNNLGGLASLAGINLGSGSNAEEIPPSLYPRIVSSVLFQKELIETTFVLDGHPQGADYKTYLEEFERTGPIGVVKQYTIGLPGLILGAIRGGGSKNAGDSVTNRSEDGLIRLSEDERDLTDKLASQLELKVVDIDGVIRLSVTTQNPLVSATLAQKAQEVLQVFVTNYKIQRAQETLEFAENLFQEKKVDFEKLQRQLSVFRDRNQNIVTATARNELDNLQANYDLAFSVYTEVAKQLETAKISVKEKTPSFTILQPVVVPVASTGPDKKIIFGGFIVLGGMLGIAILFFRKLIARIRAKW